MRNSFRTGSMAVMAAILVVAAAAETPSPTPDKIAVTDGHVFHDVGLLWNHVTNWGLIGSAPSISTPFSAAPSARWPGSDGADFLWAGGLWVGGRVLGETLVSTGSFQSEFYPTEAAGDTIFPAAHGALGGNRYPWPLADDDHDGLENEDPLNGLDDDSDGLVDEDFAAIGDQSYRCDYLDNSAHVQELYPDHTPLNIKVTQETYQWSHPRLEDSIGYEFTIENIGVVEIQDVYLGIFGDFDIPAQQGAAVDDQAGHFSDVVQAANGEWLNVYMVYMYDGNTTEPQEGYSGFVLCGHDTDPDGQAAPEFVGPQALQVMRGQAAFEDGGDPTNDTERYQVLSEGPWDQNTFTPDDYRVLLSCGPFASLQPEEVLRFQVALVAGSDLEDLTRNAVEIVQTYQGHDYNRDGIDENGAEFTVRWLPHEDMPSPVPDTGTQTAWLNLRTHPNPFNPRLAINLELEQAGPLTVEIFDLRGNRVRRLASSRYAAGDVSLDWDGRDDQGRNVASGVYRVVARSAAATQEHRVTLVR